MRLITSLHVAGKPRAVAVYNKAYWLVTCDGEFFRAYFAAHCDANARYADDLWRWLGFRARARLCIERYFLYA